jgi:hypothetical protein
MKTRFDAVNRSMLATIAAIVGAVTVTWIASHVEAFNPQPEPPGGFGVTTLARGETMRASIVAFQEVNERPGGKKKHHKAHVKFHTYGKSPRGLAIADASLAAETCSTSEVVAEQSCDVVIEDGQAASFDFVVPSDAVEVQVRPVFEEADASGRFVAINGCSSGLVLSVEVRSGGTTRFVLPTASCGWNNHNETLVRDTPE